MLCFSERFRLHLVHIIILSDTTSEVTSKLQISLVCHIILAWANPGHSRRGGHLLTVYISCMIISVCGYITCGSLVVLHMATVVVVSI